MSLLLSRINEALRPEMRCRTVDRDGNCLFRAASVALAGNYDMPKEDEAAGARQLRSAVIKFIRDNKASFKSFMQEGQDIDRYIETMAQDGMWGGEFEVSAIARLNRRPVHVYTMTETKYVLLSTYPAGSEACGDHVRLLFHGQHYDALFD
jgi:hypothetical protein